MEKHHCSTVIVFSNEQPRRALMVYHKGLKVWTPPGGHVEAHENPYEAAVREVKEETGFDITPYLPAPRVLDQMATSLSIPYQILEEKIPAYDNKPEHYHIDHVYVVEIPFFEIHNDPESNGLRWLKQEDIEALPLFEDNRETMKELWEST